MQFSDSLALFGSFQNARLVHFCTTGIVLFMIVHVSTAFLVSRTLVYTRPTRARTRNNLNRLN
jgi:thiosulfate reductase cytochrome b subunit